MLIPCLSEHIFTCRHQSAEAKLDQCCTECLSSHQGLRLSPSHRDRAYRIRPGSATHSPCCAHSSILTLTHQDPEPTNSNGGPNFLLKLSNDDELIFTFTFVIRRDDKTAATTLEADTSTADTSIAGLTFVQASTTREVENLLTREFHADPNLHKNSNVALVGDYSTSGSPSVSFEWTWKWKPPKVTEDRGGGWRNTCSVRLKCSFPWFLSRLIGTVCRVRSASTPIGHTRFLLLLGFK